jgi:hypothetical protein
MNLDRIAGIADAILGGWVFFSMFFWVGSVEHMVNAGAVGGAAVTLSLIALTGQVWARWLIGVLGVWLFMSPWVLHGGRPGLVIHHLTLGTLMFAFSALPTGRARATGSFPL